MPPALGGTALTASLLRARRLCSIVTQRSKLPLPSSAQDPKWQESWTWLYERYEAAMRRYVFDVLRRYRPGATPFEEAAEVVQGYFATCMEKGWLAEQGENIRVFRAYLQTQLFRYVISYLRKQSARRRGGGATHTREGLEAIPLPVQEDVAGCLERGWLHVAIEKALTQLQRQHPTYHEVILDLIESGDARRGSRDLAKRLDITDEALATRKHRARRTMARLVAYELRQTVSDDEAFEVEFSRLLRHVPWLESAG